jgi:hypothetical protein
MIDNPEGLESLKKCGLIKVYEFPNMRGHKIFLHLLISYWNSDANAFMMDGQSLTIEVDEMYFIIGLFHLDDVVNLRSRGGIGITIADYIVPY